MDVVGWVSSVGPEPPVLDRGWGVFRISGLGVDGPLSGSRRTRVRPQGSSPLVRISIWIQTTRRLRQTQGETRSSCIYFFLLSKGTVPNLLYLRTLRSFLVENTVRDLGRGLEGRTGRGCPGKRSRGGWCRRRSTRGPDDGSYCLRYLTRRNSGFESRESSLGVVTEGRKGFWIGPHPHPRVV